MGKPATGGKDGGGASLTYQHGPAPLLPSPLAGPFDGAQEYKGQGEGAHISMAHYLSTLSTAQTPHATARKGNGKGRGGRSLAAPVTAWELHV